ncbi:group 1 truncated hemoglobin [Alteromonas sediminis]|uniref:Group 1 truncated hemoglobin n=1 Tax=Alteromonas sediminis TaxID=2259342 RepID=A0A3N5Z8Y8_9ALTE|nr:group 1 truncated hemoglobin [Alteromonas sediminis]RPJ67374.1 group 1 truncated hemoglobin [Alteromonas sediminis]
MKTIKFCVFLGVILLQACATTPPTLYQELGGEKKVVEIVDNFIAEIEFDETLFEYFKDSNVNRFREKLIEHVCMLTDGPCEYTGDSMVDVHTGMNITESDFNRGVDLFINAMTKAGVPHATQNKVLAVMAPTRKEIIYL